VTVSSKMRGRTNTPTTHISRSFTVFWSAYLVPFLFSLSCVLRAKHNRVTRGSSPGASRGDATDNNSMSFLGLFFLEVDKPDFDNHLRGAAVVLCLALYK
jgi:hypothetical protein